MTTKQDGLLHHANIILAIYDQNIEIDNIKSKLVKFYKIDETSIIVSSSETITVFYIATKDEGFDIDWFYEDEVTFSASAYPIVDSEVLRNKGGKALKTFVRNGAGKFPEMWKVLPPLCYFHHNKQKDTLLCFNDFLGFGRLYSYTDSEVSIVASSPLAIALVMPESPKMDTDFWNAHHMFGHGMGNYSYIKGVQLVEPGTKITIANGKTVPLSLYNYQKLLMMKLVDDESLVYSTKDFLDSMLEDLKPYLERDVQNYDSKDQIEEVLNSNQSIFERSLYWFKYSSGDCTSALLNYRVPKIEKIEEIEPKVTISRIGYTMAGGVDYNSFELAKSSSEKINALLNWYKKTCYILPNSMKEESINLYKSELFTALNAGIKDYYLLDYVHGAMKIRRQFPAGLATPYLKETIVSPLLCGQLVLDNFWKNPMVKINNTEETNSLSEDVLENISCSSKVKFKDESFISDLKQAVLMIPQLQIDDANFKKLILESEQGEKRVNQLVESIFWRFSANQVLEEVLSIRIEK